MRIYIEYPTVQSVVKYNESEFIRLIMQCGKTHERLNSYSKKLIQLLPVHESMKIFPASYYLTAYNLAHIIDRHYDSKQKHQNAGKFTIPLIDTFRYIRLGFIQPAEPMMGVLGYKRMLQVEKPIGIDRTGISTDTIMIITDADGRIKTAYPVTPITHS